jgi:hypothetical protein
MTQHFSILNVILNVIRFRKNVIENHDRSCLDTAGGELSASEHNICNFMK